MKNKNINRTFLMVTFQCVFIMYMEYAFIDSSLEEYLSHVTRTLFGNVRSTKSVVPELLVNVLRSYEHVSKSLRFSREKDSRQDFEKLITTLRGDLLSIRGKLKKTNDTYIFSRICTSTTLLMNGVNELSIREINLQLNAIMKSRYRTMKVVIAYDSDVIDTRKYSKNIKWIKFNPTSSPVRILYEMVKNSETRFVVLMRDAYITDINTSLQKMIEPIMNQQADIVGLPVIEAKNKNLWHLGCYQTKVIRYQFKMREGYDATAGSLIACSYIRGPFALQKQHLQDVLTKRLYFYEMVGHLMFVDLFHELVNNDDSKPGYRKVLVVCQNCPAALEKKHNPSSLQKKEVREFVSRYKYSRMILANGTSVEYDCSEVGTKCSSSDDFGYKNGRFRPLCCIKELHDLLIKTSEILDDLNIDYELDSGSSLGGAKMMFTLPWEHDHDLDMRLNQIPKVMRYKDRFKKAGYEAYTEKGEKYIGVKSSNWRLELLGMGAMMRDYIGIKDTSKLSFNNQFFLPKSRFCLNTTLIQMGNRWMPANPNPGIHNRDHLGKDVLQHAWHWTDLGLKDSHQRYNTGSWGVECEMPGHHSCSDNYLPDGNLQFHSVWV